MKSRYLIEYSQDFNEICIIPCPSIPMEDLKMLDEWIKRQGYKHWIKADDRCGYTLVKELPHENSPRE